MNERAYRDTICTRAPPSVPPQPSPKRKADPMECANAMYLGDTQCASQRRTAAHDRRSERGAGDSDGRGNGWGGGGWGGGVLRSGRHDAGRGADRRLLYHLKFQLTFFAHLLSSMPP